MSGADEKGPPALPDEVRISERLVVTSGPMGPGVRFNGRPTDAMVELAGAFLAERARADKLADRIAKATKLVDGYEHGPDCAHYYCPNDCPGGDDCENPTEPCDCYLHELRAALAETK